MASDNATELIHLTYDGNFQLDTDATVLLCRVIDIDENANGEDGSGSSSSSAPSTKKAIPVELQLDVTTMHPQGGGQPTDTGTITVNVNSDTNGDHEYSYSATIAKVTIDRASGIVTHAGTIDIIDTSILNTSDYFPPNTSVKVCVNPIERQILSECHTAGHVVDAAMAKCDMLLPPTKGYHFLDGPYVEYKGSIDLKEREEFLGRLKIAYQELINEDIPTNIQTLPIDEANSLCNRLAQNFNMNDFVSPNDPNPNVRVVSVADWNCPCGGTHVHSTGSLKERGWCVKGLKCKKGVVRVRYGMKAD